MGLICSHCRVWHRLENAIVHIDMQHQDCLSCQAEALLCESLLEDAKIALEVFVERNGG